MDTQGPRIWRCCVSTPVNLSLTKLRCANLCDISLWIHEHVEFIQRLYGYTCMFSMLGNAFVPRGSCVCVIRVCATLRHCGGIWVWSDDRLHLAVQEDLTWPACSCRMAGRRCGLLTGQGSISRKPHNTNIYVCCTERRFLWSKIKGSLNQSSRKQRSIFRILLFVPWWARCSSLTKKIVWIPPNFGTSTQRTNRILLQ